MNLIHVGTIKKQKVVQTKGAQEKEQPVTQHTVFSRWMIHDTIRQVTTETKTRPACDLYLNGAVHSALPGSCY